MRTCFALRVLILLPVLWGCSVIAGIKGPLPAHCTDGKQDGDEKGVDCGGSCAACDDDSCTEDENCAHLACRSGRCAAPTCPGSDCALCNSCQVGTACIFDSDCATNRCVEQVCVTCSTDSDCGSGRCDTSTRTCESSGR